MTKWTIGLMFISLSFLFVLNYCKPPEYEEPCQLTCENGNLTSSTAPCNCVCDPGWTGEKCDKQIVTNKIECDFTYDGSSAFKYATSELHINPVSFGVSPDTLYIDSEMPSGEWVYFELIVPDLTVLVNDSFPIGLTKAVNTVWMTHEKKSIIKEIFSPDSKLKPSGMLYIDEYDFLANIVTGRFYATLEAGFSPVVKALALKGKFSNK